MKAKRFSWLTTARTNQLPPNSDWRSWVLCAGRGFGKTRSGAEWLADKIQNSPNTRWAVIARTATEARNVCIEGESGLLSCLPDEAYNPSDWKRSLGELTLTLKNGAQVQCFSGDNPDKLRGPQHHGGWCEELAAWKRPEAYDMFLFGLRLGQKPQRVITTTPRPTRLMKRVLTDKGTVVSTGSTFDNRDNLPTDFLDELVERYDGTTMGRQELYAELLDTTGQQLWTWEMLDACHDPVLPHPAEIVRSIVVVDPAVNSGDYGDENGIAVVAKLRKSAGRKFEYAVLADLTMRGGGEDWSRVAIEAHKHYRASEILIEKNQGGELLRDIIEGVAGHHLPVELISATKSKAARAESVAALYRRGLVSHLERFDALETQMVDMTSDGYIGRGSPDHVDAVVHGLSRLAFKAGPTVIAPSFKWVGPSGGSATFNKGRQVAGQRGGPLRIK